MCNFRYGLNPTYYFLTNTASSLSTAFDCNIQVLQFSQLKTPDRYASNLRGQETMTQGAALIHSQKWISQCFVYWGFRPCRARPTSNATLTMTRLHFATLFTTEPITKLKRKSQQTFESVWKNHMKDLKLIHLTLKTWDAKTPPPEETGLQIPSSATRCMQSLHPPCQGWNHHQLWLYLSHRKISMFKLHPRISDRSLLKPSLKDHNLQRPPKFTHQSLRFRKMFCGIPLLIYQTWQSGRTSKYLICQHPLQLHDIIFNEKLGGVFNPIVKMGIFPS